MDDFVIDLSTFHYSNSYSSKFKCWNAKVYELDEEGEQKGEVAGVRLCTLGWVLDARNLVYQADQVNADLYSLACWLTKNFPEDDIDEFLVYGLIYVDKIALKPSFRKGKNAANILVSCLELMRAEDRCVIGLPHYMDNRLVYSPDYIARKDEALARYWHSAGLTERLSGYCYERSWAPPNWWRKIAEEA